MDPMLNVDDLLTSGDDPKFITSIFNYCNGRCERCRFADRCRLRADDLRDRAEDPGDDWTQQIRRSFEHTSQLIGAWCERERIDVSHFDTESDGDLEAVVRRFDDDPLVELARRYSLTARALMGAFERTNPSNVWPAFISDALDTIGWYCRRVSSKVYRAVSGHSDRNGVDEDLGIDPVQSDWNGSAKVARLEIAESRAAWQAVLATGAAPLDSPLQQLISALDELDSAVASRFPMAMAFVRPGFDEPESPTPVVSV